MVSIAVLSFNFRGLEFRSNDSLPISEEYAASRDRSTHFLSVSVSPNGKTFAIGTQIQGRRILELRNINYTLITSVEGSPDAYYDIEWSPDGKYILTGWNLTELIIFDVSGDLNLQKNRTIAPNAYIEDYAWSEDAAYIGVVGGLSGGFLQVWNISTLNNIELQWTRQFDRSILAVSWGKDNLLATGGADGIVSIFGLDSTLKEEIVEGNSVNDVDWRSRKLAVTDIYGNVKVYDSSFSLADVIVNMNLGASSVKISPDGDKLAISAREFTEDTWYLFIYQLTTQSGNKLLDRLFYNDRVNDLHWINNEELMYLTDYKITIQQL